jgi:hypothetical protein
MVGPRTSSNDGATDKPRAGILTTAHSSENFGGFTTWRKPLERKPCINYLHVKS